MRQLIAILAVISLVAPAVPSQSAGQQGQAPPVNPRQEPPKPVAPPIVSPGSGRGTIRSTVELVLVDVRVTDKAGKSILGLKPEQFTVTEENHPQKISSFEYNNIETRRQGAWR